jgi:hypothetical protein
MLVHQRRRTSLPPAPAKQYCGAMPCAGSYGFPIQRISICYRGPIRRRHPLTAERRNKNLPPEQVEPDRPFAAASIIYSPF